MISDEISGPGESLLGCTNIFETYEEIVQAAQETGCQIEGIKLYISSRTYSSTTPDPPEIRSLLCHILRSLPGNSSFELSLEPDETGKSEYYLKYDHNSGELDLVGVDFESDQSAYKFGPDDHPDLEVARLLNRLDAHSLAQITIKDCWVEELDLLEMICSPRLENLTLQNVGLWTVQFDTNFWSTFLDRLSRKTQLKYLRLSHCWYDFDDIEAGDDKFQLPSGIYQVNPELDWGAQFYLAPGEDGQEEMVLSDRKNISGQIKALADRVAQMEVDKVAEIEREGWVRTDIVGFVKDSDADGVVVPDEEEHGNVQVNENDENRDTHGENGDHNELEGTH